MVAQCVPMTAPLSPQCASTVDEASKKWQETNTKQVPTLLEASGSDSIQGSVDADAYMRDNNYEDQEDEDDDDDDSDGELIIDDKKKTKREKIAAAAQQRKNVNRREVHHQMKHAKEWLLGTIIISNTVLSLVSIEDAYKVHCDKTGQEPISTPVLARLIRTLFRDAVKCRLGPRGNQKIHYRNLSLRTSEDVSKGSPENDIVVVEQTEAITSEQESFADIPLDEPINLSTRPSSVDSVKNKVQVPKVSTTDKTSPASQQDSTQEECEEGARKLSEILKWINNKGLKDILLKDFAHSASCKAETCSRLCMMFKRVRRHVVAARHACSVLKLYSSLLRLHVSSCHDSNCGLPACPALRATKPGKRSLDHEVPAKRIAVPSSLVLAPRSPTGSLPGSVVNSPLQSPELGDGFTFPPGQVGPVQYMIVPVRMATPLKNCTM